MRTGYQHGIDAPEYAINELARVREWDTEEELDVFSILYDGLMPNVYSKLWNNLPADPPEQLARDILTRHVACRTLDAYQDYAEAFVRYVIYERFDDGYLRECPEGKLEATVRPILPRSLGLTTWDRHPDEEGWVRTLPPAYDEDYELAETQAWLIVGYVETTSGSVPYDAAQDMVDDAKGTRSEMDLHTDMGGGTNVHERVGALPVLPGHRYALDAHIVRPYIHMDLWPLGIEVIRGDASSRLMEGVPSDE